ncbi:MAG: response regulator [Nitrososphaera sp.]
MIEDDPGTCYILGMILKLSDFDVVPITDPDLALAGFNKNMFDLILLDIGMPKMNGFALYQKIREIDRDVKVCFMTDYGRECGEEYRKCFPEVTNEAFVDKPIMGSQLIKILEELLAK